MPHPNAPQAAAELPGPEAPPNPVTQQQEAIFKTLLVTVQHFFGGFARLFHGLTDPRSAADITYPLPALLATGVLLFLLRLGARRQINQQLRGNAAAAAKYQAWFRVANCPHGDTLNDLCIRAAVPQVQEVVTGMTETRIRRMVLYAHRLLDQYFLVVIDGTGMLTFTKRHCPHCMTRTSQGRTLYYHPVLEAKLVTATGLVFSLMTEFIENPNEYPTKQDCELKAFYRLAPRLKQRFPRLPLCLLLDGLFAGSPVFTLCEQYRWQYIIVLPEKDLPSVHEEFDALLPLAPENQLLFRTGVRSEIHQTFHWMNDIAYAPTPTGREHTVAVIRCLESKPDAQGQRTTTRFKGITNFTVTPHNLLPLANQGGRLRWKIENEGFNVKKNGGYALEHVYSQDPNASKVFYLLLQIAHLVAQLIEHGSLFRQAFPKGVGSAKNIAFRLLEAWRNLYLGADDMQRMLDSRIQIRFAPP